MVLDRVTPSASSHTYLAFVGIGYVQFCYGVGLGLIESRFWVVGKMWVESLCEVGLLPVLGLQVRCKYDLSHLGPLEKNNNMPRGL